MGSFLAYDAEEISSDPAGFPSVRAREEEYLSALTALHGDKDAVEDVLAQVRSMLDAKAVREEMVDRYVDVARADRKGGRRVGPSGDRGPKLA